MTATPALQTTEIFGDPVYTYSYQQTVLDGYLVDHDAPVIIKTKLAKEGIHFKKGTEVDIFDQDEKTINKEKLPDNMNFDVKDFNHRVITRNFNKVVCDELVKKYLDPTDPYLGKTLIFAATDAHADMVVDLLKQAFKEQGRPVDDDAIEKITGSIRHPNQEIKNFKNEENPNIVVTVDLLTTGIDVPRITNIVFLRRVQSRILYEQMLGRATRLCPEITYDEKPFDLPDSWEWVRLGEVGSVKNGKTPKKEDINSQGPYPYFKVKDMNNNRLYMNKVESYVDEKYKNQLLPKNTIIFPKNSGAVLTAKKEY